MGSPKTHKDYWRLHEPKKSIIAKDFLTREDANSFEVFCIELQWLKNKDLSLNACIRSINFCRYKVSRTDLEKPYFLVSPKGEVAKGINLKKFCLDTGLDDGTINDVISGKRLHSLGWTASVKAHELYIHCYENRGISYDKIRRSWVCQPREKGKRKRYPFKTKQEAMDFRDKYELEKNYTFQVHAVNWREKLKDLHKLNN
jgi:hypothetical protein